MKEFRKDNKRIVKKRFKQVDAATVFEGFLKTCIRLFGYIPNIVQMAQLVMKISCIKPRDEYSYHEAIKEKGQLIFQTIKVYSVSNFNKLFQIEEFGFIVRFIVQNHLKGFLALISDSNNIEKKVYEQTINFWTEKII